MKKLMMAALLVSAATGAVAQNIDIDLGGSGYYGRIDLGNLSRPPVIFQQPMIIERAPDYRPMQPMYLRVPPGHAKKWSKHCSRYDACGRPVYFVQDSWYSNTYAPRYRQIRDGRDGGRNVRLDDRRDGDKDFYKERDKDRKEAYKEQQKDRKEFYKEQEKDHKEYYKEQGKKDKHDKHGDGHGKDHGKGNGNGKH